MIIYSANFWNLSDFEAGRFVIAMQVGLSLANLFFGFLSDRKGHKLSLEICWALRIITLVLLLIAPGPIWLYPIFFIAGAVNAGTLLSGFAIVYEFTDAETRPTYIGLSNTIPGVIVAISPVIGGWIAGVWNYRAMFFFAAIAAALSWIVLRFSVQEPRKIISQQSIASI